MQFRKLILCALAVISLTSCMKQGSFKTSYIDYCSFEYSNIATVYGTDSLNFESNFAQSANYQTLVFMGKRSSDQITDINEFQGGVMLSLLRDTVVAEKHFISEYSTVADTTGADGSKGFAVLVCNPGNMPEHTASFAATEFGTCTPHYMKVCNTNQVVNTAKFGSDICPAFKEGDYIKLIVTGILNGQKTAEASIDLVNYTTKGLEIITNWTKMDLSKIGDFDHLDFNIETNVPQAPRKCCFDSLVLSVNIER